MRDPRPCPRLDKHKHIAMGGHATAPTSCAELGSAASPGIKGQAQAAASHVLEHQGQPLLAGLPEGQPLPPAVESLALQEAAVAEDGPSLAQPLAVGLLGGRRPGCKDGFHRLA